MELKGTSDYQNTLKNQTKQTKKRSAKMSLEQISFLFYQLNVSCIKLAQVMLTILASDYFHLTR